MTPCPHQHALLRSLRSGSLTPFDEAHRLHCTACAEAAAVASVLLRHAAALPAHPPSPAGLWQRAQAERQTLALRRAAGLMSAMRCLGVAYLLALVAWSLRALWSLQPRAAVLSLTTGALPHGLALVFLVLLSGAAALLALGQRPGSVSVR